LPLHPNVYARLLGKKIAEHQVRVWLVNTGWTGGPYGTGKRIYLPHTRAMVRAALTGRFESPPTRIDPYLAWKSPVSVRMCRLRCSIRARHGPIRKSLIARRRSWRRVSSIILPNTPDRFHRMSWRRAKSSAEVDRVRCPHLNSQKTTAFPALTLTPPSPRRRRRSEGADSRSDSESLALLRERVG